MKAFVIQILNLLTILERYKSKLKVIIGARGSAYLWRLKSIGNGASFYIGTDSLFMSKVVFERSDTSLFVGNRTFVGGGGLFSVSEKVVIGNDVLISWGCTVCDHDSHSLNYSERKNDVINFILSKKCWDHVKTSPIIIGDKVWIGFDCSILKGVTIGEGAVVAARSNVVKDVPPWALVGGNPARVIRMLNPE